MPGSYRRFVPPCVTRRETLSPKSPGECLLDRLCLLVAERYLAPAFRYLLHVQARRLARVKAGDDETGAARIEQSDGEALLPARVLKRVEANDADLLKSNGRASFHAR